MSLALNVLHDDSGGLSAALLDLFQRVEFPFSLFSQHPPQPQNKQLSTAEEAGNPEWTTERAELCTSHKSGFGKRAER